MPGSPPAIILVEPQLGENIGAAARAMLNCGLESLRIVNPRDGWPNEKAVAAASGADRAIEAARIYDSTAEAVADLRHVYAATARARDMTKPAVTPRQAGLALRGVASPRECCGGRVGPGAPRRDGGRIRRAACATCLGNVKAKHPHQPRHPEFKIPRIFPGILLFK